MQRSHTTSWYAYDADNCVAVTDGDLVSGAIAVSGRSTSYAVTYDTVGNMVMRPTKSGANLLGQHNVYDNRGELVLASFASALDGSNDRGVAETRTYDAGGNVIIDNQYYSLGTTATKRYNPKTDPDSPDYIDGAGGGTGANIGGYLSTATVTRYDSFGRVSAEQTFGHDEFWDGTGGDTMPGPLPDENATSYAGMTLQTSVLYQGPGGSSAYDAMGNIVFYQYRVNSQRLDQYTVTYLKKEGYLESATSGVNVTNLPDVRPDTDESYYNVRGERIAIAQHTQYGFGTVADTVRVFAYDGNGQIISRHDGTASGSTIDQGTSPALKNQHYVYVNGQQVAHYDESTTVDVLSQVTAFSNSNGSGDYVVQEGDTLKSIAQAVYGNASLWYIVAQANALNGDADLAVGLSLSIPAVTTSKNDSTTFKPYNPSEIQGSTTPNLPVIAPPPPPPKQHCNVIAAIVVIAVVVVASILTAGAALAAAGATLADTFALGATALAGGAGFTAATVGAAALGGFVGSVAGQVAGDALGVHQGFSFGEALTGGLTAGATAGLGGVLQGSATFSELAANGSTVLNTAGKVALATGSYAAQNASAAITGQDHHFSWAGVVASAASAFVPSSLHLPTEQDSLLAIGSGAENSFLGEAAGIAVAGGVQREVSRALGDDHTASWESIGESAVATALVHAAGGALEAQENAPVARQSAYSFDLTKGGQEVGAADSLASYDPPQSLMVASGDGYATYTGTYHSASGASGDPSTTSNTVAGLSDMAPWDPGVPSSGALPWESVYDLGPNTVGQALGTEYAQFAQHRMTGYLTGNPDTYTTKLPRITVHATPAGVADAHWDPVWAAAQAQRLALQQTTDQANERATREFFNNESKKVVLAPYYAAKGELIKLANFVYNTAKVGGEFQAAQYAQMRAFSRGDANADDVGNRLRAVALQDAAKPSAKLFAITPFEDAAAHGFDVIGGADGVISLAKFAESTGPKAIEALSGLLRRPATDLVPEAGVGVDVVDTASAAERLPVADTNLPFVDDGPNTIEQLPVSTYQRLDEVPQARAVSEVNSRGYVDAAGESDIVPNNALVDAEVSALQRIAANNSVDTGSAARMARIDELTTANYNRLLQNDLAGTDYVYRAVPENMLDIYRAQGSISGRGGSSTYFSLEGGASPLQQKLGAQLLDEPQVLLKIPTSELVGPTVPRPFGYSSVPQTIGREYFVNSYPQYGAGGFRQFMGTTNSYSDSWIVSPWGAR